ncbi:MgPME-cyclase complex family protein [Synechococcus sp. M16CYN]|uniref:MgPME-cyclase complex family protein n=1 Tax=Synechococcus sp. M16CYN TaxID=3103139 RepID=UPI0030DE1D71
MTIYHFVAASEQFLIVDEPLEEVLRERQRNYVETNKEIDFWLIRRPAFLQAPGLSSLASQVPQPAAAIISTDKTFITFLKLRLEYVVVGRFEAPTSIIPDATSSNV